MADEPDNVVLRLLQEIWTTQQAQGEVLLQLDGALARIAKIVEDLYKTSADTLGVYRLEAKQ